MQSKSKNTENQEELAQICADFESMKISHDSKSPSLTRRERHATQQPPANDGSQSNRDRESETQDLVCNEIVEHPHDPEMRTR